MARTYRLEHFAKGTGATVVPNEDDAPKDAPREQLNTVKLPPRPRRAAKPAETTSTALPPGHVRKKATGEIGRVKAVDPGAGTATVFWLKQGRTSVVPLASISRR